MNHSMSNFINSLLKAFHFIADRISKLFDRVIYSRSASLIVSLLLSVLICLSLYSNEISLNFLKSEIVSQVLTNVPVEVQLDLETYSVSGLPDTVNVLAEGPSAELQVLKNQNNLVVIADLRNLGEGLNEIGLTASNVPSNVSAQVDPSTITIEIERKVTRTFLATPELLLGTRQSENTFNTPTLLENRITITGTRSLVNSIRSVKAIIDASGYDESFEAEALIVAYDSGGKQVTNLTITPESVGAIVTIKTSDEPARAEPEPVNTTDTEQDEQDADETADTAAQNMTDETE